MSSPQKIVCLCKTEQDKLALDEIPARGRGALLFNSFFPKNNLDHLDCCAEPLLGGVGGGQGQRDREKKRERERPLKEHICDSSAQHHHVLPSCHAENISTFQSGGLPSAPLLCTSSVCLPDTPACLTVSPSSSIPLNWRYSKTQVVLAPDTSGGWLTLTPTERREIGQIESDSRHTLLQTHKLAAPAETRGILTCNIPSALSFVLLTLANVRSDTIPAMI